MPLANENMGPPGEAIGATPSALPPTAEPSSRVFEVQHNDFWHKDESNWGQFFVGRTIHGAANYDKASEPVVWMLKSHWVGGSARHKAHNEEQQRLARLICDTLNRDEWARENLGLFRALEDA